MTVEAIRSAAQSAGKTAMEGGTSAVKALGRGFEYLGGVLSGVAKTVANWVRTFFNNLPQYFQVVKDYAQYGMNFIRQNKHAVAVGSGIGVTGALVAMGIGKLLSRAEEI